MSEIKYRDFELKIEPRQANGSYSVSVNSPAGQGRGEMRLTRTLEELRELIEEAEEEVRGIKSVERDVSAAATTGATRQLGDILFTALFSGMVRDIYNRNLGEIARETNAGLRIKLRLNPEDATLAELATLPWELLYQKETRDFLNLQRNTPVIRYLDVPRPTTPLPLQPPLRVLVCMASPIDKAALNLDKERRLIKHALGGREDIKLEFLRNPTPDALRRKLLERPYHVLHFMGHGGFDKRTGRGALLLMDEAGASCPLTGERLGVLLSNNPTIRLVLLNACETARSGAGTQHDPFGGVAAALVLEGILAVVAMQFPITDAAAVAFTRCIYPLLARGAPIDTTVADGRQAIYLTDGAGPMEWATPVLFMRSPNGRLFDRNLTGLGDLSGLPATALPQTSEVSAGASRTTSEFSPRPRWLLPILSAVVIIAVLVVGLVLMRLSSGETPPAPTITITGGGRTVVAVRGITNTPASSATVKVAATATPIPPTNTPVPPTDTPLPAAGAVRISERDGAEMVYVPAGEFIMGSEDGADNEKPVHTVYLDAYWIDKYEVTNAQFKKCVDAGTCTAPTTCDWGEPTYQDADKAGHPVVCVDWENARKYCEWAEKRLPTEAEWEKAARGTDGRTYPWGNEFDGSKVNFCDKNCEFDHKDVAYDDGYTRTAPVGSYPSGASPYNARDMAGNVWEWVVDWYDSGYYSEAAASQANPQGPVSGDYRVVRGGSWGGDVDGVRSARRGRYNPDNRVVSYGFRCAASPGSP